jgi:hypothetical protein
MNNEKLEKRLPSSRSRQTRLEQTCLAFCTKTKRSATKREATIQWGYLHNEHARKMDAYSSQQLMRLSNSQIKQTIALCVCVFGTLSQLTDSLLR